MPLLKIVPLSDDSRALYEGHSTYHEGDSGLDLFVATDITIGPGETKLIPLGFSGALYNNEGQNVSWLLMPRSSIYKTPIRLANSSRKLAIRSFEEMSEGNFSAPRSGASRPFHSVSVQLD